MATELSFKDAVDFLEQLHAAMTELIFFYEVSVGESGLAAEPDLRNKIECYKQLRDELLLAKEDYVEFSDKVKIEIGDYLEH
jgi:hypothetical protein